MPKNETTSTPTRLESSLEDLVGPINFLFDEPVDSSPGEYTEDNSVKEIKMTCLPVTASKVRQKAEDNPKSGFQEGSAER